LGPGVNLGVLSLLFRQVVQEERKRERERDCKRPVAREDAGFLCESKRLNLAWSLLRRSSLTCLVEEDHRELDLGQVSGEQLGRPQIWQRELAWLGSCQVRETPLKAQEISMAASLTVSSLNVK
jgi:hypothetical protein